MKFHTVAGHPRLASRWLLGLSVVFLVMVCSGVWWTDLSALQSLRHTTQNTIAQSVLASSEEAIFFGETDALSSLLQRHAATDLVAAAVITNADGLVVASSDGRLTGSIWSKEGFFPPNLEWRSYPVVMSRANWLVIGFVPQSPPFPFALIAVITVLGGGMVLAWWLVGRFIDLRHDALLRDLRLAMDAADAESFDLASPSYSQHQWARPILEAWHRVVVHFSQAVRDALTYKRLVDDVVNSVPAAIVSVAPDGRVLSLNTQAQTLLRIDDSRETLVLFDAFSDSDAFDVEQVFNKLWSGEECVTWEAFLRPGDDTQRSNCVRCTARIHASGAGEAQAFIVVSDLSDELAMRQQIESVQHTDPLSQLLNRVKFEEQLSSALRDLTPGHEHVVLSLDGDRFSAVNEGAGYDVGNVVIQRMAEIIVSAVQEDGVVARLSGDEFAVLLRHANRRLGCEVAERILRAFRDKHITVGDISWDASVSIGVVELSAFARDADGLHHVLPAADAAMFTAKALGGERYQVWAPDNVDMQRRQLLAESALKISQCLKKRQLARRDIPVLRRGPWPSFPDDVNVTWCVPQLVIGGDSLDIEEFQSIALRYRVSGRVDEWLSESVFSKAARSPGRLFILPLSGMSVRDTFFHRLIDLADQYGLDDLGRIMVCIHARSAPQALICQFVSSLSAYGIRVGLSGIGSTRPDILVETNPAFVVLDRHMLRSAIVDDDYLPPLNAMRRMALDLSVPALCVVNDPALRGVVSTIDPDGIVDFASAT